MANIVSTASDEALVGTSGNDSYIFSWGFGNDTISDAGGVDTLNFSAIALATSIDLNQNQFNLWGSNVSWSLNTMESVVGGSANDVIQGDGLNNQIVGNYGHDTLSGNDGNDSLEGGSGNDTLSGGAGNDTLNGGFGNDNLDGGLDNDRYVYSTPWGADVITDAGGTDTLDLSVVQHVGITINLNTSDTNEVTYGSNTINWDNDVIEHVYGGTASDSITGTSANNNLYGNYGNDTISGGTGNDYLDGGAFSDSLSGGDGDDTMFGGSGNDTLNGGEGDDTYIFTYAWQNDLIVDSGGNDTLDLSGVLEAKIAVSLKTIAGAELTYGGNYISWDNDAIENIILGPGGDLVAGNDANNRIIGNLGNDTLSGGNGDDYLDGGGYADTLNGGSGNDTLIGGSGNDVLNGDDGDDTYVYSGAWQADTITDTTGNDTLDLTAVITNLVVNLTPNTAVGQHEVTDNVSAINWSGNVIENVLSGSGNDLIYGNAFNNSLSGGGGNDTLQGGSGNDTYQGYTGSFGVDTIYDTAGTSDILDLGGLNTSYVLSWEALDGVDADSNVEDLKLTFDEGKQILIRNYFANDNTTALGSNSGAGLLEVLRFGNGDYIFSQVLSVFTELSSFTPLSAATVNDVVTGTIGKDDIWGLGGNETLNGGSGNDKLKGESGHDVLNGEAGEDTLLGGAGNDVLNGGDGNDTMIGGSGNDTLNGGSGTSTAYFEDGWGNDVLLARTSLDLSAVTTDLTVNVVNGEGGSGSVADGVNSITWNGDNLVSGVHGGSGNDTMTGGVGLNLNGGAGDDIIFGGGIVTLNGGEGNDTISGQAGNTTYKFDNNWGNDTISHLTADVQNNIYFWQVTTNLTINLNSGAGHEVTDGTNTVNWDNDVINNAYGSLGDDLIIGNDNRNELHGREGNDTIIAGGGDDVIHAGRSSVFTMTGPSGNDSLEGGLGNDSYDLSDIVHLGIGMDIINDIGGTADHLGCSYRLDEVSSWEALDGADGDLFVDTLKINFTTGDSITIQNYFSNTTLDDNTSTAGVGCIETIGFVGPDSVNFAMAQSLIP